MKKIFTLALLALVGATTTATAQSTLRKTWDFREGFSTKTINALKADQEEFGADKYWRNYEGDATKADNQHFWNASKDAKNASGFACTHNGGQEKVIPELDGLILGMSNAKKFVITYDGAQSPNEFESEGGPAIGEMIPHGKSYVWLNGKNETITFQAAVNQTIKIGVESHAVAKNKLGEARGITLTTSTGSLDLIKGEPKPTYYTECEWNLSGTEGEVADLTLKSTNGCHIYYIIVGEGDDPNANKTKVGYLTAGDATSEAVYTKLQEQYVVTAIDAATFKAADLAAFDMTVVSPALPADNAGVATLKEAFAYYPILNLNAGLYGAWGYGETVAYTGTLKINNLKHELLSGLTTGEDGDIIYDDTEDVYGLVYSESELTFVKPGEFFAGDDTIAVALEDPTAVGIHIHNPYHNGYIYMPYVADVKPQVWMVIDNAIAMLKGSKSEITQAPAPKITLQYKNLNTNIVLTMASKALPKAHIYYTLDGTTPTAQSLEYTGVINITSPCTVKAVAIAEGYLLSEVAEAQAEIFSQPEIPVIATDYQSGKTVLTLTSPTADAVLWYNFSKAESADTTHSMRYIEPITVALPTDFTAFAVSGGQVFSELTQQRVVVKEPKVRIDQLGLFDANAAEYQKGGSGSTIYYFSWGKSAVSIYDTTAEPIGTTTDPETGDEISVYPERDYEYYIPQVAEDAQPAWEVKSKGQVMIWQSLTAGNDPGNADGYNPETAGDVLSYAKIINNDIQFGGKVSGEPCTGVIQSLKKYQGPFDVITHVGTASGGDNVGKMLIEISTDSLTWTVVGDTMVTSTTKRLWKSYIRNYEGTDEVYVRVTQAGGGSSVQIYDIYIMSEGELSIAKKTEYETEYQDQITGITEVSKARKSAIGIYSLKGTRLNAMQRGLNIIVDENGQVRKVMMK